MRPALAALLLLLACTAADTKPPEVTVAQPAAMDTVRAVVTVKVRAVDNDRVARVRLLVDGRLVGTDTSSRADTFEFSWDTRVLMPGSTHQLAAAAWDEVGNADTSDPVAVVIDPLAGTRHQGLVGSDQTWSPDGNPHVVDADLTVAADLTIRPGVVVLLVPGTGISVGSQGPGRLIAAGTADSAVRFTAASYPPDPGSWRGLSFGPRAESSAFLHCLLEYGGAGGSAMLESESCPLSVVNCTLTSAVGPAISVRGGRFARLAGNRITACAGLPLVLAPDCVGSVEPANSLRGNGLDGIGIRGGTLADSATWVYQSVPYYMLSTLTVAGSRTPLLVIAAACTLLFADSARLRVGVGLPGALDADGAYGRIVFSSAGSAGWPGIEFWDSAIAYRSLLRNCVIDRAGLDAPAAVFCYRAAVNLSAVRVLSSRSHGIQALETGFSRFDNTTVTGCAGYPVRIDAPHVGTIGPGNSFAGNGTDAVEVGAGTVAASTEWRAHGVPYFVQGSIDVASADAPQLVVASGAVLSFADNAALRVGAGQPGALLATGVPDSVTFTGRDTVPGHWRGIELHPLSGRSSVLNRCRILYGGAGAPGTLYINTCSPSVTGCEIGWSANYCIAMYGSPLDPDSLEFYNWLHDWGESFDDILYEPR